MKEKVRVTNTLKKSRNNNSSAYHTCNYQFIYSINVQEYTCLTVITMSSVILIRVYTRDQ